MRTGESTVDAVRPRENEKLIRGRAGDVKVDFRTVLQLECSDRIGSGTEHAKSSFEGGRGMECHRGLARVEGERFSGFTFEFDAPKFNFCARTVRKWLLFQNCVD